MHWIEEFGPAAVTRSQAMVRDFLLLSESD